tara:strand:+ start:1779 stop:2045 length:267 start_codon:yes stop_codon:yes gene_type:complete
MDIDNLRIKINLIDLELLKKLKERMIISKDIGILKKKTNTKILDSDRERQLLDSLIGSEINVFEDGKNEEFITELWNVIMKFSKKNQV